MIRVETSQGEVVVHIPEQYTKVGVKISGGADSALVAYMLALYKKSVRGIELVPITVINAIKPHQHIFAQRVVEFIEKDLNVKFNHHQIKPEPVDPDRYGEEQTAFVKDLRKQGIIETHFTGITQNPDESAKFDGSYRDASRDKSEELKPTTIYESIHPFINIDKKAVAELYNHYDLMDTLFPITRSCESTKVKFTEPHCGKCWWCKERLWGFGRLD